ncbi:helix-turn-helix transcriptional regulator [Alteromonas macleodii]|uniref:helix-turn-helix transcriptional regulator n=1 Tax=Alteromonas TaxID=226 RepID=UPI001037AFF2|nr:WYL domain-containing protein [Alteromonas sp. KUL17]TAP26137.1 WYL domain-containing protein [Alteromonas sp. KUL17]
MAKTNFKDRVARRSRLLGLLRSEQYWTTSDLREHLDVSQRTLMRELVSLKEEGYPIESDRGRGGGVRLVGRWGIERLMLSHKEVIELLLALSIIESLNLPFMTNNLEVIKQKLYQAFPENQRFRVSRIRKRIFVSTNVKSTAPYQASDTHIDISQTICESFLEQRCLNINYSSENKRCSSRTIESHYLMLAWPVWYIVAWDHLRNAPRIFRIDRIQSAEIASKSFKLRPELIANDPYTHHFSSI